jgi:two-component system, cell cycle response regulator
MSTAPQRHDLVPLAERLVYLRILRGVMAVICVLDAALVPKDSLARVATVTGGYLGACLLLELAWKATRGRGIWLFGSLLILDGLWLGWATYVVGGTAGPVRYLIMVHMAAVTLLGSYRTGLKVAMWHSLVQLSLFYLQRSGELLKPFSSSADRDAQWYRLVVFILALWALTITIASLAAINERELRRRRYEMEQLALMGRLLEDANDPLSVGDVLLEALGDTFGFRRMAIFEVSGPHPRLLTSRNTLDADVPDFTLGEGSVLQVTDSRRSTLLVAEIDETVDPWLAAIMPDARNLAVVPLLADGVVAVLVAETGQRNGSRIERRVIATTERYAGHAALAIRNVNLLERVQQMAVTDGLTQLANRRSFDRSLDRELTRAVRMDGRLSVVLLDIDNFKLLNDSHGHVAGDTVLRQVAAALRECGREYDTIARYGGEEFAAVLPGCSSGLAMQVAERLRAAVEEAPTEVPVTASAGVATYPYDGIDIAGLLSAADQALYASKRAGRNTVRSAEQARSVVVPDQVVASA